MDKTLHSGYDSFTPAPGEWLEYNCKACGTKMEVRRNCEGPTSFVSAIAKLSRKYDHFTCPNSGQEWHTKVILIKKEIQSTSSDKLKKILESEVEDILKYNVDKLHS